MKHPILRICRHVALLLTLPLCFSASLANPNVPPAVQTQPIILSGATVHTVSGADISNARLRMDQGRITAIGPSGSVPDDPKAILIDLTGRHIYPGLISANSSVGLTEIAAVRATIDTTEVGSVNPNARALVAINADSDLIPVTRANGVLAVLTVPRAGRAGLIAGTSALIQLDGWNWADMAIQPAVALHVVLPRMRLNASLFVPTNETQLAELRKLTTERLKLLEDAFKSAQAYDQALSNEPGAAIDTRWDAMRGIFAKGAKQMPVFVHAGDITQIRYALDFAQRFDLKITLVGGQDAWRVSDVLRERKIGVIVTGVHSVPTRHDEAYDSAFATASKLAAAGVQFCIARSGGEFDSATERALPFEAASAAAHGLPSSEALKAITLYPAQMLGVADKLGSLEVGKLANLFVSTGDPLDIRSQVQHVFIQGRELALRDRQTDLRDKYQQRYKQQGLTVQ